MTISFDAAFGIHPQALIARAWRSKLLAQNIANADTPGYRARDLDFSSVFERAAANNLAADRRHLGLGGAQAAVMYRTPTQSSLDANSVDAHAEKARFLENAIRYQASLTFLNHRIEALRVALGAA